MPKNRKTKAVRTGGTRPSEIVSMIVFLSGCLAEIYLFIVRRYANGTARQMVAWNERYFPVLAGVGAAILAAGVIWAWFKRENLSRRNAGICAAAAGAFIALVSLLGIWDLTFLDRLVVIVPVVTLLGIVWGLYDRGCAVSLTVLGLGTVATWLFSRTLQPYSPYLALSRVLAVILLAALAALMFLLWNGKLRGFLPPKTNALLLYVSCALSCAGILASLLNVSAAGYAMWVLAFVAFGLLVYYTVKQM